MTELATLIEAMCQGTATQSDRDRLEKLLRDPAHRAEYLAASRLHSELLWRWHRGRFEVLGPGQAAGSTQQRAAQAGSKSSVSPPRRSRGSAAAFAALVFNWLSRQAIALSKPVPMAMLVAGGVVAGGLGIAAMVSLPPPTVSGDAAVRWPDARITGLHEANWRSPKASFGFADPLYAGTTLDLESGLVELRYEGGATVVLEGPATLRIEGRKESRLSRGRLTAKLEKAGDADQAAGRAGAELPRLFTIHTPKASVHDLGTEFGVDVREAGDADVHVFDGLVELASVGAIAPTADAAAFRLAAGDAARIDEAGRITATGAASSRQFVRSLPQPKNRPKSFLAQIGWDETSAETIYRDSFRGGGPLAGSAPAVRGGTGAAAWIAPPQLWDVRAGALWAESPGSGLLPFRPEPGWLYRLTVTLDVVSGRETSWCAIGFREDGDPVSDHSRGAGIAWMLQRPTAVSLRHGVFAGPADANPVAEGDRLTGRHTRSVVLDTTGPAWRAFFMVDDKSLGSYTYSSYPFRISHVGVSIQGDARARIESFSFERARNRTTDDPKTGERTREDKS